MRAVSVTCQIFDRRRKRLKIACVWLAAFTADGPADGRRVLPVPSAIRTAVRMRPGEVVSLTWQHMPRAPARYDNCGSTRAYRGGAAILARPHSSGWWPAAQPVWIKRPRRGPGFTRCMALQYGAAELLGIRAVSPTTGFAWCLARPGSRGAAARLPAEQGLASAARARHYAALASAERQRRKPGPAVLRGLAAVPERSSMLRGGAAIPAVAARRARAGTVPRRFATSPACGDGFGAIDFEDDLEPSMPLELRQARDIFLFLISAARYCQAATLTLVPQLLQDALRPRLGGGCGRGKLGRRQARAGRIA